MGYYEYSLKSGFALASFQRMIPLFARDFPISACVCSFRVTSRQERFGDLARSGSIHSNQAVILPNPFPFTPFLASGHQKSPSPTKYRGKFLWYCFLLYFPSTQWIYVNISRYCEGHLLCFYPTILVATNYEDSCEGLGLKPARAPESLVLNEVTMASIKMAAYSNPSPEFIFLIAS